MGYFKELKFTGSERFVCAYAGINAQKIEEDVDFLLTGEGYVHKDKGVYEKGSRTLRILFGAFCKYYKFQVSLDATDPNEILVGISRQSSGMSGGVIGMNQMKKEMERLKGLFQAI